MDEVAGEVDQYNSERSNHSIYSAVIVIGVAFFFAFVAYGGTDALQTASGGDLPRTYVMAIICITSVASSILLAPAFVGRLSPNMALCVAWGSHALYAMANLYPTAASLLLAAFVVGATFPAVAVAQGVYTAALVDRWCGRQEADAGGEEDIRIAVIDRSRSLESCGCAGRTTDDRLRRQNVFVFFNSILMACMGAGCLCGITITPLLIGLSADEEATTVTLLVTTAAAFNCSVNGSNTDVVSCITGFDGSTLYATTTSVTATRVTTAVTTTIVDEILNKGGVRQWCGVNNCPYLDAPSTGRDQSSPSTWHALIFILLCNAVGVVLTAFLPSLLTGNVLRPTPSSASFPGFRWQATPLNNGEGPDGYRMVGSGTRAADSVRQKTVTTLYLFGNRRLLLLAPTIIVTGLSGSLTVAAFHQSFAGCDSDKSMIGYGTAYQRGTFIVTSLLTGQLAIHFIRRRIVILVVLLAAVVIIAITFTWQSSSSDHDLTLIIVWCIMHGAVAGVLRAAVCGMYPTLTGRSRLDSVLLHANLWDSVGAALAVLVADWLCLVIRAWIVIFVAGFAAVGYAGLECTCNDAFEDRSDRRSGGGSSRLVDVGAQDGDRESLASVCISPNETASLSTISSNRLNVLLHPFANRAYYTRNAALPTD